MDASSAVCAPSKVGPCVGSSPSNGGFFSCFFAASTVKRAVRVALVVGPILGLINHFDLCLGAELTTMRAAKIAVTFLVPFSVSAYSSATAMLAERHGRGAPVVGNRPAPTG